jgi:hypothetical protein
MFGLKLGGYLSVAALAYGTEPVVKTLPWVASDRNVPQDSFAYREGKSSRAAHRLRERGRNCFDAPHRFAIINLLPAIRALVEREVGDRIGSSLRFAAPVTPHAPDSLAATSWTYFQVDHNSLRSLGRDEEIVGISSVIRHQLAFRIDRHAIQIFTLDDVEIFTGGPPQGTTGTKPFVNARRIENRLGYIHRRQPVPFHLKPGFFAEGVAPCQDRTLDSNQDIAHGSSYFTTGGSGTVTFSLSSPVPALTLDSSGHLTGTPTQMDARSPWYGAS